MHIHPTVSELVPTLLQQLKPLPAASAVKARRFVAASAGGDRRAESADHSLHEPG